MVFFNNFQKRFRNILKRIENGNASESNIASFCELLDVHKKIIPEAIGALNDILIKGNIKAFNSAISAYNRIAQNHIGEEHYLVDVIVSCMRDRRNDMRENSMLKILEILSITTQKYPERMKIAVPELLIALESNTPKSRELSFFILSILSATHHEFFKGLSKEIIRVLNGLNVDERIYAIRLTKKLAEKEQANIAETYDLIEDLCLNHPDSKLRSEAGFAMDKLKAMVKSEPVMKIQTPGPSYLIKGRTELSEDLFSGLPELIVPLMVPDKEDMIAILQGMNLEHLIVNK
ncbi:MAG: hypothetical protein Q7J35_14195 [Candidatus Methanoperedens sp.]|nr:hypothetical protein [Candidatus Methanoperedens sp.]